MKIGLDVFQAQVGEWADRTFPDSTPRKKTLHFQREARELVRAVREQEPKARRAEEAADCFLILLHFAEAEGFSLLEAAHRKFGEIQQRKWGPPDKHGVVSHIRDDEA